MIAGYQSILTNDDRMVWSGRDLKDGFLPTSPPWAGTPCTRHTKEIP